MRRTFATAISHPDDVLASRDATNQEGSDLILDNLTPPSHPHTRNVRDASGPAAGSRRDGGADRKGDRVGDEREIGVTFWVAVESGVEARIVGTIAYWAGCWEAGLPLPVGGRIEDLPT